MTNHERLIEELGALDMEELWKAFGPADLANRLGDRLCADCPRFKDCEDDDVTCPSWNEWGEWEWNGRQILAPDEWP